MIMPTTELATEFEHRADVEQRIDRAVHVVRPQPVDGDDVADLLVRRRLPRQGAALEIRQVLLRRRDGRGFVGHHDVDDAVGALDLDRADLGRLVQAEPATLDHRRTAHPDVRVLGGDHHVAATEDRRIAGEAVAGVDPDERDGARQLAEPAEREAVEAADADAVGVAGPSTAALGEEHDRQPQLFGEFEQPVLLAVVLCALGAGEHRVVVRHRHHPGVHRCAGRCVLEQCRVGRADTTDEAIGGRVLDQIVE